MKIIKAFSVDATFDFKTTKPYESYCTYFLFDTKGENYGGNGTTFNWELLKNYRGETAYFLSGGIGLESLEPLHRFFTSEASKNCIALDLNSKFETGPGIKDIEKLKEFKHKL